MESKAKQQQAKYLPECLLTEIFLRLPFKSLARFKCVSKSWCNLASDRRFMIAYMRQPDKGEVIKLDRLGVARLSSSGEPYISSKDFTGSADSTAEKIMLDVNGDVKVDDRVRFGEVTLRGCAQVMCSLDGLVVLSLNYDNKLFLWNPSIRKYKEMERHTRILDVMRCSLWGICKCDDDYKVVWICRTVRLFPGYDPDPTFAEFFSVKAGSWRGIRRRCSFPYAVYRDAQGVNANGNPHWVVGIWCKPRMDWNGEYRDDYSTFAFARKLRGQGQPVTPRNKVIIFFNATSNKLGEIGLPCWLNHMDASFSLGVLGGCLCMAHNDTSKSKFEISVMMEYGCRESWTRLFTFKDSFNSMLPICLMAEDEILMEVNRSKFVIYSFEKKQIKKTLLSENDEKRFTVVAYAESWLSPLEFPSEPYPEEQQILDDEYDSEYSSDDSEEASRSSQAGERLSAGEMQGNHENAEQSTEDDEDWTGMQEEDWTGMGIKLPACLKDFAVNKPKKKTKE